MKTIMRRKNARASTTSAARPSLVQMKKTDDCGAERLEREADDIAQRIVGSGRDRLSAVTSSLRADQDRDGAPATGRSGNGLPAGERTFFENRFGENFGGIRIHANSTEAARMNARAFASGRDIHFSPGEYRPGTFEGRRLLAHELTHTLQQRSNPAAPAVQLQSRPVVTCPSRPTPYFFQIRRMGSLEPDSVAPKSVYKANVVLTSAKRDFRAWVNQVARAYLHVLECLGPHASFLNRRWACQQIDICRFYREAAFQSNSLDDLNGRVQQANQTLRDAQIAEEQWCPR